MFQNFLEKIRNDNERRKKRLLIALTGVVMLIIIASWMYYMNSFVLNAPGEETTSEIRTDFWAGFKTGFGVTLRNIKSKIENITSETLLKIPNFGKENKITIENK